MFEPESPNFFDTVSSYPNRYSIGKANFKASNDQESNKRPINPIETATLLLKVRSVRVAHFQQNMPEVDDVSWHMMLDLIVAERTGEVVDATVLAANHALSESTARRYVDLLHSSGLIDHFSNDASSDDQPVLSLTEVGRSAVEACLKKIDEEIANS